MLDKNRNERSTGHHLLADAFATEQRYDLAVPVQRTANLLYGLGT